MSHPGSVRVTIFVDVDPAVAFEVFTEEMDAWYKDTIPGAPVRERRGMLRFDEAGRRVLRGDEEIGRIVVWQKGQRLVFVDRRETEVDVRFEPEGAQTRVTLEHRGLERLSPADGLSVVQYGWRRLAVHFEEYMMQKEES